jgi:hypothetical protein
MALLANPLHKYASHNYVWTLSAMYPGEVNRPEEYLGTQGKLPIIISGGVGNRKTTTTQMEEDIDSNVEFFIDDVILDSTFTPTSQAPNVPIANLSFKVYEPYSLGLFLQTAALAARRAGFDNYIQAPYLLSLQFKGWHDDGTYEEVSQKNFVISISAINFTAAESGAVYEITAIPYTHQGIGLARQGLKEELSITGSTVAELLSSGEQSLSVAFNKQEIFSESTTFKVIGDQYQITFPFDISSNALANSSAIGGALQTIQKGLDKVNNTIESIGDVSNSLNNLGNVFNNIASVGLGNGLNNTNTNTVTNTVSTPGAGVNSTLDTIGSAINDLASAISIDGVSSISNEIGSSAMIDSFNEFGTVDFADEAFMFDAEGQVYNRESLSIDPSQRVYTYPQGSTIEQVITSVVLLSKWGQSFITRPVDDSGMRPWFKIKVKTYILSVAEMETAGRPAFKFVYEVSPYFIHSSSVSLPSTLNNTDRAVEDAVKAYNYMYTGLNRDVVDFDITYNAAYFMGRPVDNNQASVEDTTSWGGSAYATPDTPTITTPTDRAESENTLGELRSTIEQVTNIYKSAGGTFIDNDRTRAAKTFRDLILNNPSDLVAVDLTIMGDPYYLTPSDYGNYVSDPLAPNININLEADPQRGEVFILLKFNTPVDYNRDLLLGDPADQFTGLYRITSVEHNFQQGKFLQTLKLTRVAHQRQSSIDKLKNIVDTFFAGLSAISNFATQIGAEDVASSVNNFIQEAGPAANSLLGLAQIGSNLKEIASGDYQTIGDKLVGLESFFDQVQQLETQYRSTIESLSRVDFDPNTPFTASDVAQSASPSGVTTTVLPSAAQSALATRAEEYAATDPGYQTDTRSDLEIRVGRLLGMPGNDNNT